MWETLGIEGTRLGYGSRQNYGQRSEDVIEKRGWMGWISGIVAYIFHQASMRNSHRQILELNGL
jgi:hypothetical protein